jgi:hypothetical protein
LNPWVCGGPHEETETLAGAATTSIGAVTVSAAAELGCWTLLTGTVNCTTEPIMSSPAINRLRRHWNVNVSARKLWVSKFEYQVAKKNIGIQIRPRLIKIL